MRKSTVSVVIFLLLTVILAVTFASCKSDKKDSNDGVSQYEILYKLSEDGSGAVVTGVSGFNHKKLTIPSEANVDGTNYPVVALGAKALENFDTLQSVDLPDTLKKIEDSAFFGCDELLEVKIPDTVEQIGKDVFMKCRKLVSVKLSAALKQIGSKCFAECVMLKSIVLPDSLQSVPEGLFYGCVNLRNCAIGDGVVNVDNYAFSGCRNLENLIIGKNVAVVGNGQLVIDNNSSLHLDIKSQNVAFGENAFAKLETINVTTYSLENIAKLDIFATFSAIYTDENGYVTFKKESGIVEVADSYYAGSLDLNAVQTKGAFVIDSIAKGAFEDNAALEQIVLPDGINFIPERAFASCINLSRVQIPESVEIIENKAFFNCNRLTFFNIDKNIDSIGEDAFEGCENICFAVNKSSLGFVGGKDVFKSRPYVLNCKKLELSEDGYVYGVEDNGYVTVCDNIDKALSDIVLPGQINGKEVAKISDNSFYNNIRLRNFYIPNTLALIGENSFVNCFDLNVFISYPSVPEKWGTDWIAEVKECYLDVKKFVNEEDCLYCIGNNGLVSIVEYKGTQSEVVVKDTVEDGKVVEIKANAFRNNGHIERIEVPASLTKIGDSAFAGCINLKEIVNAHKSELQYIGDGSFYNCKALRYFYIGDKVIYIGKNAFELCYDTVVCYGAEKANTDWHNEWSKDVIVRYNSNITEDGFICQKGEDNTVILAYIGKAENIILPEQAEGYSITGVPQGVFEGNTTLKTVVIPSSYKEIEDRAFAGCVNLQQVNTGTGIEYVGADAFEGCTALSKIECGTNVLMHIPTDNLASVILTSGTAIPDGVLQGSKKLQNVVINDGIKAIGKNAFKGCSELAEISLPANLQQIGEDAFADTAFYNETLNWENGALYLRGYLLALKDKNITSFEFAKGTTLISDKAFEDCAGLQSITIPSEVVFVGEYAFANCQNLNDVSLGENVKSIGSYAFADSALKTIEIPLNVEHIGKNIFSNCNMTCVYVQAKTQPDGWDSEWNIGNFPVVWDCVNSRTDSEGYIRYTAPDNGIRYLLKDGIATVDIQSRNLEGDIVIPSSVSEGDVTYNVEGIKPYAFENCTGIATLTINEGVKEIGEYAFYNCSSLNKVSLPSSLLSIASKSFAFTALEELTIPAGVESISSYAFDNSKIKAFTVEETNAMFSANEGVIYNKEQNVLYFYPAGKEQTEFTVPDTVRTVMSNAFFDCDNLQKTVIPATVGSVKPYAFLSCDNCVFYVGKSLNDIWLAWLNWNPDKRPVMYNYPDYDVSPDNSIYVWYDDSLYVIENGIAILYEYKGVNEGDIVIPQSVNYKGVDYKVREIAKNAFNLKGKAVNIHISSNIETIEAGAFECDNIDSFVVDANNPNYKSMDGDLYSKDGQTFVKYCTNKAATEYVFNAFVKIIEGSAFSYAKNLQNVVLTENIHSISDYTFAYCAALKNVVFPSIFSTIGKGAFRGCKELQTLNIEGINVVGDYAFADCVKMQNIVISEDIDRIGMYAFSNCISLTDVTVPGNVRYIGQGAFEGCINLRSLKIEEGVAFIEARSFRNANNLISVEMPSSVKEIGAEAFENCKKLQELNFADYSRLQSIGKEAFASCVNLKKISLPDSLRVIKEYAFANCVGLREVVLSDYNQLGDIGSYAFSSCEKLLEINISNRVTTIGENAFTNCEDLLIYCENTSAPSGWESTWNGNAPVVWNCKDNNTASDGTIYFDDMQYGIRYALKDGAATVSKYIMQKTNKVVVRSAVIYNGITYSVVGIDEGAFEDCDFITSVELPDTVTSIGANAFAGCKNLLWAEIPDSVASVGANAFDNIQMTIICPYPERPLNWAENWAAKGIDVRWTKNDNNFIA